MSKGPTSNQINQDLQDSKVSIEQKISILQIQTKKQEEALTTLAKSIFGNKDDGAIGIINHLNIIDSAAFLALAKVRGIDNLDNIDEETRISIQKEIADAQTALIEYGKRKQAAKEAEAKVDAETTEVE